MNKRDHLHRPNKLPAIITAPKDVYKIAKSIKYKKKEYFLCLYLNAAHQLIDEITISSGNLEATPIYPKKLFFPAIKLSASYIILVHNHPSGLISPSKTDLNNTKKLVKAGKLLQIKILDHIIISPYGYYSFKAHGHM